MEAFKGNRRLCDLASYNSPLRAYNMSDSEYDPEQYDPDRDTYNRPSTTSSRNKKDKVPGPEAPGYKIRSVLTSPRPTTYSAQAIYGELRFYIFITAGKRVLVVDQILDNEIDLDPEYQRSQSASSPSLSSRVSH